MLSRLSPLASTAAFRKSCAWQELTLLCVLANVQESLMSDTPMSGDDSTTSAKDKLAQRLTLQQVNVGPAPCPCHSWRSTVSIFALRIHRAIGVKRPLRGATLI